MYHCQTKSKKLRNIDNTLGQFLKAEQMQRSIDVKHFKRFYAGKPTKKYLQFKEQVERAQNINHNEILNSLL